MAFLILTMDKPDTGDVRARHRAEHYRFLERHAGTLIASGGLQDDAGSAFIGAAILIDCETRAEAEAFCEDDPFFKAGLFESVQIVKWKKAFLDGKRVV